MTEKAAIDMQVVDDTDKRGTQIKCWLSLSSPLRTHPHSPVSGVKNRAFLNRHKRLERPQRLLGQAHGHVGGMSSGKKRSQAKSMVPITEQLVLELLGRNAWKGGLERLGSWGLQALGLQNGLVPRFLLEGRFLPSTACSSNQPLESHPD